VTFTLTAGSELAGRRAQISVVRFARECAAAGCRVRQVGRPLHSVLGRLADRQTITAPRPGAGRTIRVQVRTQPFDGGAVLYGAASAMIRWTAR